MRRKDDEKALRIKEAVIRVILEEGFGNASISKIARSAGVSQATVYIYHDSKESMLRSVYTECAEEFWDYLIYATEDLHDGRQIVEKLVSGYYTFMTENEQLFRFVEQYASCPALMHNCSEIHGFQKMLGLLQEWEEEGIFRPYQLPNLFSLLFNPVKMLAAGAVVWRDNEEALLRELVGILQETLLPPC